MRRFKYNVNSILSFQHFERLAYVVSVSLKGELVFNGGALKLFSLHELGVVMVQRDFLFLSSYIFNHQQNHADGVERQNDDDVPKRIQLTLVNWRPVKHCFLLNGTIVTSGSVRAEID